MQKKKGKKGKKKAKIKPSNRNQPLVKKIPFTEKKTQPVLNPCRYTRSKKEKKTKNIKRSIRCFQDA